MLIRRVTVGRSARGVPKTPVGQWPQSRVQDWAQRCLFRESTQNRTPERIQARAAALTRLRAGRMSLPEMQRWARREVDYLKWRAVNPAKLIHMALPPVETGPPPKLEEVFSGTSIQPAWDMPGLDPRPQPPPRRKPRVVPPLHATPMQLRYLAAQPTADEALDQRLRLIRKGNERAARRPQNRRRMLQKFRVARKKALAMEPGSAKMRRANLRAWRKELHQGHPPLHRAELKAYRTFLHELTKWAITDDLNDIEEIQLRPRDEVGHKTWIWRVRLHTPTTPERYGRQRRTLYLETNVGESLSPVELLLYAYKARQPWEYDKMDGRLLTAGALA